MRGILMLVGAVLGLGMAGCGPESPRAAAIEALRGDPANGQALFSAKCAACHKAQGFENMIGWYPRRAFLSTVVLGSENKKMPSFAQMSDQDIADIYAGLETPAQ